MPRSIAGRLLWASAAVVAGTLALTALALEAAFERSARASAEARLQSQVYMLLGAAELDAEGRVTFAELPEPRLSAPGSGLYARVSGPQGELWHSASALAVELPPAPAGPPGQFLSTRAEGIAGDDLIVVTLAVDWETEAERNFSYRFQVAEAEAGLRAELSAFRRHLWSWLAAGGSALMLALWLVLQWSIRPLRRVARELRELEDGRRERLSDDHPLELRRVVERLNAFAAHSQERLRRYREATGNLAHSLKTPLALLRGAVEEEVPASRLRAMVADTVERLDRTVEYQLRRAAALGHDPLSRVLAVGPPLERLVAALRKVHASRNLALELRVAEGSEFPGDEGDLTEIAGNLLDNACKWAASRVAIDATPLASGSAPVGLALSVEDDGPGVPAEELARILERGVRLDPARAGAGIGLAVVRELVQEIYGGELSIDRGKLGGARVRVRLPGRRSGA